MPPYSTVRTVIVSGLMGFLGGALALTLLHPSPVAAQRTTRQMPTPVPTPVPPTAMPTPVPLLTPALAPTSGPPASRRAPFPTVPVAPTIPSVAPTIPSVAPTIPSVAPTPAVLVATGLVIVDEQGRRRAVIGSLTPGDPVRGTDGVYGVQLYDATGTRLVGLLQTADVGQLVVGDTDRPPSDVVLVQADAGGASVNVYRRDGSVVQVP